MNRQMERKFQDLFCKPKPAERSKAETLEHYTSEAEKLNERQVSAATLQEILEALSTAEEMAKDLIDVTRTQKVALFSTMLITSLESQLAEFNSLTMKITDIKENGE